MSLPEFLLARVDEAEARARRAQEAADGPLWVVTGADNAVGVDYDPAHVLAWCAAIRAIVELPRQVKFTAVNLGIRDAPVCLRCHSHLDEPDDWPDDQDWSFPLVQDAFPCRTLRALAQPFADHPDFDPAWGL